MEPQTFQALAILFGVMVTIIGALVMLWIRSLQVTLRDHKTDMEGLRRDHTAQALNIASNYMPRPELEKKLDAIFALLEEIRKEVRHA
jgi:hypothetical protein